MKKNFKGPEATCANFWVTKKDLITFKKHCMQRNLFLGRVVTEMICNRNLEFEAQDIEDNNKKIAEAIVQQQALDTKNALESPELLDMIAEYVKNYTAKMNLGTK